MKLLLVYLCALSATLAWSPVDDDLKDIFKKIKVILDTDDGLQELKDYISALQDSDPEVYLIKSFFSYTDDASLHQLIDDLFSGLDEYEGNVNDDLGDLFHQVKLLINTDAGYAEFKTYITNLQTTDQIVYGIQNFIEYAGDDYVKKLLNDLLAGV